MPANYAHYRFGVAMLGKMPGDIARTVKRFRWLYDMGLHGPDLFYYHNPLLQTKVGALGSRFHKQTGQEFFGRVCRSLRLNPTEAGQAYLYGLLCHYALDSLCHPFLHRAAREARLSHLRIEGEFDRFLLETDGKTPPHTQNLSLHIRLTPGECETVAKFYPPATAAQIRDCVRNMAAITKLFSAPEGTARAALQKGVQFAAKDAADRMIPSAPDSRCAHLNGPLLDLYRQAEERFPTMLTQLSAHMTYNAALGEEFLETFG